MIGQSKRAFFRKGKYMKRALWLLLIAGFMVAGSGCKKHEKNAKPAKTTVVKKEKKTKVKKVKKAKVAKEAVKPAAIAPKA